MFGRSGIVRSGNASSSFIGRRGSNNCADPVSDVILSVGGVIPTTDEYTNQVWRSFDGQNWAPYLASTFTPPRHFSSCDVDEGGRATVIGGHAKREDGQHYLLGDVWHSGWVRWRNTSDTENTRQQAG
jgi:hypothetical protein